MNDAWSCPFCFVTDPELRAVCARCTERDAVQAQINALTERVASVERADTEYRRAQATGAQPRLMNAGTAFRLAMIRLFRAAKVRRA